MFVWGSKWICDTRGTINASIAHDGVGMACIYAHRRPLIATDLCFKCARSSARELISYIMKVISYIPTQHYGLYKQLPSKATSKLSWHLISYWYGKLLICSSSEFNIKSNPYMKCIRLDSIKMHLLLEWCLNKNAITWEYMALKYIKCFCLARMH